MELCRLPRRPHEALGLALEGREAIYFDVTILRASMLQRREETAEALAESNRAKDIGIGAIIRLLAALREEG